MSDKSPDGKPRTSRAAPLAIISIGSIATALGLGALNLLDPVHAANLPDTLGTVPAWITSGGVMGLFGLGIYWHLGSRKVSIEGRATDNIDKADIRDHYANEVASLRAQVIAQGERHAATIAEAEGRHKAAIAEIEGRYKKLLSEAEEHYRNALQAAEDRHEDCMRDREALRAEVQTLKDEIEGFRRQWLAQSADRIIALGEPGGPSPSEDVLGSAHRVRGIVASPGADKPSKS